MYEIKSIEEFLKIIPAKTNFETNWVYRGHGSIEYELVPSLFRRSFLPPEAPSWELLETYLLARFKKQAFPLLDKIPESQLSWISLAQHHGLPTRLLDWAENPLTALFFAVENLKIEDDCCVWHMNTSSRIIDYGSNSKLPDFQDNSIFFPIHHSQRMNAQQGCFSFHKLPTRSTKFKSLESRVIEGETGIGLKKYIIPKSQKEKIKIDLDKLGINYFSIFPDLDGLAKKLIWGIDRNEMSLKKLKNEFSLK